MAGPPQAYRFGPYTLDVGNHRLLRGPDEVELRPKAYDTLRHLVEHRGRMVSKDELLDSVWAGVNVSEAVLTHCVAEVRQALQDDPRAPRFIRTLPKVGYAFVASVEASDGIGQVAVDPGGASAPPASHIAVLPFANISTDEENEYFCDGLSEELINGLTRLPGLRVVAHSSSFSFKGRDLDARAIGRQLGVGSILEGSVRKSGDRLRVSAQLIDATTGHHRWCEQYDRRLEDVFAVQDEISRAVLGALKAELLGPAHPALITPPTRNMDAYLLYLQGRFAWHRRFAGQLQAAMACFEKALALDPEFAPAYTGLADSLSTLGVWAFAPAHEVFPKAAALARRALALDPALADAHASLSLIQMFYEWDWASAERALTTALQLNPGAALSHVWAGHLFSIVGRLDEAVAEMELGRAIDPLSPITGANVGWTFHLAGRQDRAAEILAQVLAQQPQNALAHFYLGFVRAALGNYEDALCSFRLAAEAATDMPWSAESMAWVHGLAGDRERAREILQESLARRARAYVPSSGIACIHLGLGDDAAMFEWLTRAVDERDALLPWLKHMPAFDRVRPDPRFQALLARLGLA